MTQFVTYKQLYRDVQEFATQLPRDIVGVLGVARSGMLPATQLALFWNSPLSSLDQFLRTGSFMTGGIRDRAEVESGKVLIIDDSIYAGQSMKKAQAAWQAAKVKGYDPVWAAVYRESKSPQVPCHTFRQVKSPRYFEWNLMHHSVLPHTMSDIDGILCLDPVVFDDDGPKYERGIVNAIPLHIPSVPVHTLISMRLERWRRHTETWLEEQGVTYGDLILCPCSTADIRRRTGDYGGFKGRYYRDSDCRLFIESDSQQSRRIAEVSKKPVICLPTGEVF